MAASEMILGDRKLKRLLSALVIAAAILAHVASVSGPFQFDDERDIAFRDSLRSGIADAAISSPFRAITYATYAVDFRFGDGNPTAFHITNILLHATASVLLFFLLCRLTEAVNRRDFVAAAIGAALFAVHPANSASVDYISGRAGILAAIASIAFLSVWSGKQFKGKWAVLVLIHAFALFCKEDAVVVPVLAAAIGLLKKNKAGVYIALPSIGSSVLYGLLRVFAHPVVTAEKGREVSFLSHLLIQPYVFSRAFFSWLWPVGLSADHHPTSISSFADVRIWLPVLSIGLIASLCIWALRKSDFPSISAGWFLFALLPTAMTPLADPMMENRWYFAMCGLALASAAILKYAFRESPRVTGTSAFLALAMLFSICVWRSAIWADSEKLWAESVRLYPQAARPWSNFAQAEFRNGKFENAISAANVALRIEPLDAAAWNTLGLSYKEKQMYREAVEAYGKALNADPDFYVAYTNRGNIFATVGRYAEAESDYRNALKRSPENTDANYGLAYVLVESGRGAEATAYLRAVLDRNPNDEDATALLRKLLGR